MEFKVSDQRISYQVESQERGYLSFHIDGTVYVLDSTVVDPILRGQGIAGKLMEHFITFLVEKNAVCRPVCSYTVTWFERHAEYAKYLEQ